MAVKIADTLKALSNTFPVAECIDIDVNINGETKRLQEAIDNGEIGGGSDSSLIRTEIDDINNNISNLQETKAEKTDLENVSALTKNIYASQLNGDFKENVLEGLTLTGGKCYPPSKITSMENYLNDLHTTTNCYMYSPLKVRDDSGVNIYNKLIISDVIRQGVPIGMMFHKDGSYAYRIYGGTDTQNSVSGDAVTIAGGKNIELLIPEDVYYVGFQQWYQTVRNPDDFKVLQQKKKLNWLDLDTTNIEKNIEDSINRKFNNVNNNIITVKKDGTGDFTQIIQAVESIENASPSNRYTIKVYDGIYDIYEEAGGYDVISEVNSNTGYRDIGVCLPQYVDLIGVGNVTLEFLPEADEMTDIAVSKVSPLNLVGNNTIENITIECKNCRYAVHDETGGLSDYYNGVHIFKDCTFIHHGQTGNFSWGQTNAYACGFDVGNIYKFENCNFISTGFGNACSFHDRVSNTVPTSIDFNNCSFTSLSTTSLRFGTVGTGNRHKVNILNCNFSDCIVLNEETTGSGVGIGYVVKGSGNNIVPHVITNTKENDNELHFPIFVNEKSIMTCRNEITRLTKNTAYAYNQRGSAYPSRATGNRFDFIALEDIKSSGFGLVFKHGYIQESILNLTTSIGDSIYFENGSFSTSGTNKIGENDGMRSGYVLIY